MKLGGDRHRWPWMVRWSLWRLPDRTSVWVFIFVCLFFAIGSISYGFINHWFFFGAIWLLPAAGYYLAMKWVDRNGKWY